MFGLTGHEGNHGEDVKECYFYLDNIPSHSYMKMLYKYPQRAYPYADLVEENRRRTRNDPEYELLDTGIFDADRYFDVFVEYAKAAPEDILIRIRAVNRGPEAAPLHLLPTLWFRNDWSWYPGKPKPRIEIGSSDCERTRDQGNVPSKARCSGSTVKRRTPRSSRRTRRTRRGIPDASELRPSRRTRSTATSSTATTMR